MCKFNNEYVLFFVTPLFFWGGGGGGTVYIMSMCNVFLSGI